MFPGGSRKGDVCFLQKFKTFGLLVGLDLELFMLFWKFLYGHFRLLVSMKDEICHNVIRLPKKSWNMKQKLSVTMAAY
jgi:hypothetical protein